MSFEVKFVNVICFYIFLFFSICKYNKIGTLHNNSWIGTLTLLKLIKNTLRKKEEKI